MSRSSIIIITAILIILTPLLGFPRGWEPYVLFLLGGIIVVIELYAVIMRAQDAFFRDYEVNTEVYGERIQSKVVKRSSGLKKTDKEKKEGSPEGEESF